MAVAAFCLAGLLMPFFYQSGEEIRIDDRVNYFGESGEIELLEEVFLGRTPEMTWAFQLTEHPPPSRFRRGFVALTPPPAHRCSGRQPAENQQSGRWFRDDRRWLGHPAQAACKRLPFEEKPTPWQHCRQVGAGAQVKKHLHVLEHVITKCIRVHERLDVHTAKGSALMHSKFTGRSRRPPPRAVIPLIVTSTPMS